VSCPAKANEMTNRYALAIALLPAITGLASSTAHAANESFCRQYSKDAAAQVQRLSPLCRSEINEPRYNADIEVQYRWCRSVSVGEAKVEIQIRHARTLTCR
jgi:hypothetical protein